ncbi:hypothetical protein [Candidatus Bandiella numerosa]|nr:hypothetical protein [Candidatus Bandiella numerosa]
MSIFQSNIINIYGEKGKTWIDELPELVAAIASRGTVKLMEIWPQHNPDP